MRDWVGRSAGRGRTAHVTLIVPEPSVESFHRRYERANGERIISGMTTGQRGRYATLMHSVISQAQSSIPNGVPAEEAGQVIADAIASKRPRTRYTIGRDAAIIVRLVRFLSDRTRDSLLARILAPHLPKAPPTP